VTSPPSTSTSTSSSLGNAVPRETADPVADARAAIGWAHERFGSGLCLTASFGDATLPHLADSVAPGIEITLLDTGYLFAETDWYVDHLRDRYGLAVRVLRPNPTLERDVWQYDTEACCNARKVEPLTRALARKSAWVTGLRRSDSAARRSTPLVHHDLLKGVTKINPLAAWTDAHVAHYTTAHDLPPHPLADRNYTSIGCWPCTKPAVEGEDPRSGRWAGSGKTECGLHR
jgi:phosphoadenosine phosphosulfate reductase